MPLGHKERRRLGPLIRLGSVRFLHVIIDVSLRSTNIPSLAPLLIMKPLFLDMSSSFNENMIRHLEPRRQLQHLMSLVHEGVFPP
jgi:hypothetical protein